MHEKKTVTMAFVTVFFWTTEKVNHFFDCTGILLQLY